MGYTYIISLTHTVRPFYAHPPSALAVSKGQEDNATLADLIQPQHTAATLMLALA